MRLGGVRAAALPLLILGTGCDLFRPEGCDVCTTSAVVHGFVARAEGGAVPGAVVVITAFHQSCAGPERYVFRAETGDPGPVQTDLVGRYETRLRSPASPGFTCLRLEVTPPAGSGLGSAIVEGALVYFDDDYPRESRQGVRVDVQLGLAAPAALGEARRPDTR
jgi:hypothetical protein